MGSVTVTSPEMADKARALDRSSRLDNPINLSRWFPERPYFSASAGADKAPVVKF